MTIGGPAASVRRVARIDLAAFAANLTASLAMDDDPVLDARADAYGHGAAALIPLALDLGISTVRVSPNQSALPGIKRSSLMTVPSVRRLIGAEAYGLVDGARAVMTLSGEVIAVKDAPEGVGVSYGYSYRTPRDTTLALVALGYADGIPRLASNRASLAIGGAILPLVGRVAMDQLVVDCGDQRPSVGDEAVLFGEAAHGHPTAIEWAEHAERSPLTLTANLGWRVERIVA